MLWSVQLAGKRKDLERFAKSLTAEMGSVITESNGGYLLHLSKFDTLEDSDEVKKVVVEFLRTFNPANAADGVKAASVWRRNSDGTKTVFLTVNMTASSSLHAEAEKVQ